ncbi:MAG: OmpA family protein [Gammaproteobacteria bacterium]|nr:OmpA family protein [Gammaproteobacteria bacterium]MCB1923265.1 OmpA family protein [Gammaproteobacteria bacterium]
MSNSIRNLALAGAVSIAVAGCATQNDPNERAKIGAAVGAVAGAVLGHQLDDDSGRWVGAAVGALAGAGVGHYMDNQQRDFEAAMQREREANQLEIERLRDDTLKLTVDSEVSFDFGKSDIKPAFRPSLDKLANLLLKYDRTVVHVVGHTDSIGSESYNQGLSERRAMAVGDYLASYGVPRQRLRTEGRGETEPREDNATEAGRQLNRRVEVFVKPVVEGQEQRAYEPPRYY